MRKNTAAAAAAGRVLHGGTQGNRRDCERSACSGFMSANADTCLCRGDVVRQGGMDGTRAESPLRASQTPLTTPKRHFQSLIAALTVEERQSFRWWCMSTAASVIMHLDSLNQGLNTAFCSQPSKDSGDFVWMFRKSRVRN